MKPEIIIEKYNATFEYLEVGDYFLDGNTLYLKTSIGPQNNAVELASGILNDCPIGRAIKAVDVKIIVKQRL